MGCLLILNYLKHSHGSQTGIYFNYKEINKCYTYLVYQRCNPITIVFFSILMKYLHN